MSAKTGLALIWFWNLNLVRKLVAKGDRVECAIDISRKHVDLEPGQLSQMGCKGVGGVATLHCSSSWRGAAALLRLAAEQLLCSKTEVGRSIIVARIPLHQCTACD